MAAEPHTLSPINFSDAAGMQINNLLFQSLLGPDLADGQLKPVLAKSMPHIEQKDAVTYITYEIREEARWANGTAVTSDDVAFTLKVLKAPLLQNEHIKPQVAFIRDLLPDKANNRKFTFVCDGFTPEMELLSGDFFILPAYLYDPEQQLKNIPVAAFSDSLSKLENNDYLKAYAARFNTPVYNNSGKILQGSAGYLLEEWIPGQSVMLRRKENWWGNNLEISNLTANPERIIFHVIPDNTTAILSLKNQQLDVLSDIPALDFDELKQNQGVLKDYNLHTPDSYAAIYTGLNSRLPKFKDKRTRQAIAHLLDTENIIKVTQQSYATPTVGIVPPAVTEYYNTGLKPYKYDITKAKQLLEQAGWQQRSKGWYKTIDGKEQQLTITAIYKAGNNVVETTALIFKDSAGKLGIPVQVEAQESGLFSQNSRNHTFELFFRPINGNPFAFNFKPILHTSYAALGGTNYTGFGNAATDKLLDDINKASDKKEKAALLKQLQVVMQDEATFLTLYYQKERIAIHNRFQNTKVSGLQPTYDVSAFMLKK
ncbi:ABC transporter substrate-binding protein [Pontibacter burrus]|uniref:ABC transporter substrate-binding protein n=1 Tax=Pontibacter burrus TaxID=2704466 RepID=A0A6B3LNH8_9BACT|nr:ABC transporter substrate-binding protein [Pontibacter burrus]NEM97453.1 ABC transporter substrate-binding protein [Pontibacter burrus]